MPTQDDKLNELLAPPPTKTQLIVDLLSKIPQGRAQIVNALLQRQLSLIYRSFAGTRDPDASVNVQAGADAARQNKEGLDAVMDELEKLNRPR